MSVCVCLHLKFCCRNIRVCKSVCKRLGSSRSLIVILTFVYYFRHYYCHRIFFFFLSYYHYNTHAAVVKINPAGVLAQL